MANQFGFQMSEAFLRACADYLTQVRESNPGRSYVVTFSVDLVPDGVGYEITGPPQITIEEEKPEKPAAGWPSDEQIREALHNLPGIDFPPGLPLRLQQLQDDPEDFFDGRRALTIGQKRDVVDRLFQVWQAVPKLRLGQLLTIYMQLKAGGEGIFCLEDLDLIEGIERCFQQWPGAKGEGSDTELL